MGIVDSDFTSFLCWESYLFKLDPRSSGAKGILQESVQKCLLPLKDCSDFKHVGDRGTLWNVLFFMENFSDSFSVSPFRKQQIEAVATI